MSTTYSAPPTAAQIDRMTNEERADVIGWLQCEIRLAKASEEGAVKTVRRLDAEKNAAQSDYDAAKRRGEELNALLARARYVPSKVVS